MHLRESRTSKFSGLHQIYPPVTLKYPLVQKLIETPGCISLTLLFSECEAFNRPFPSSKNSHFENKAKFKTSFCVEMRRLGETQKQPIYKTSHYYGNHLRQSKYSTRSISSNVEQYCMYPGCDDSIQWTMQLVSLINTYTGNSNSTATQLLNCRELMQ